MKFGYGFKHGLRRHSAGRLQHADVYVGYNVPVRSHHYQRAGSLRAIEAQNLSNYGAAGGNCGRDGMPGAVGYGEHSRLIAASGKVGDWNHSFYAQDAWTVGKRA